MSDLFGASWADFSACRTWRYTLWRRWDGSKPYCMFIGLNPSTADEVHNDPTIRRCIRFAFDWGFGSLCMTNLFAVRTPVPAEMKRASDPIGPRNNQWLSAMARDAGKVVAAWGVHGAFMDRDRDVSRFLSPIKGLKCLGTTKDYFPKRPLYVPAATQTITYIGRDETFREETTTTHERTDNATS